MFFSEHIIVRMKVVFSDHLLFIIIFATAFLPGIVIICYICSVNKKEDMPRVFKAIEIEKEEKEVKRDYLDRHMPHVDCPDRVKRGEKFRIKVKMGEQYTHPDDYDHYISLIQLWNRETLLAEARYTSGVYGNKSSHAEIDFYIVAPEVSMNLSAMAVCTKHGLWQSEDKLVKVI